MGIIDITIREIIQQLPEKFIEILTGKKGKKLLETSFPEVKERRVDLLVELEDNSILHLEIQSINNNSMPFRMLEYFILIKNHYPEKDINQIVIYTGDKPLCMKDTINLKNLKFNYVLKDVRDIDCKKLHESKNLTDKILGLLCLYEKEEAYFNNLIQKLLEIPEKERKDFLIKILNLLTLRPKLKIKFTQFLEDKKMPITITEDIIKNDPFYQEGFKEGTKKAILNLKQELNLEAEKIAEILKISLEEVEKILSEINK